MALVAVRSSKAFEQRDEEQWGASSQAAVFPGESGSSVSESVQIDGVRFCVLFVKLRPASSSDTHFQTFALDQEKDLMVSVSVCVCVSIPGCRTSWISRHLQIKRMQPLSGKESARSCSSFPAPVITDIRVYQTPTGMPVRSTTASESMAVH